jgi:ankyrin repeat protein
MRGLCRSLQLETPGEVLQALANTVKLISHVLDAYLNNYPEESDGQEGRSCLKCGGGAIPSCLPCSCGAVHLLDEVQRAHNIVPALSASSTPADGQLFSDATVLAELAAGQIILQRAEEAECTAALPGPGLSSTKRAVPRERRILSADDLMPAITYVLIQANPPNIEFVLWMCAEFRNPALLRGEEAFCLAQLSSAMEFCKHADHRGFDIPHAVYNACMLSYTATLKLLLACKAGDLPQVQDLVRRHSADINGLSPDHKDSPLTACIRFGRHDILRYLLSLPGIDVNAPVQLFHGPNQRTSPLLLAVKYNQLEMAIDLLVAGADRNYCDDSGVFAFSIAAENTLPQLQMVLQADPCEYDLVDMITAHDQLCAIGLLLQKVEVNYLQEPERLVSPLIAAVQKRDVCLIRFLLNRQLCRTEVNLCNARGETALLICALEFARAPSQELIDIAAMLLRFGADRYLADHAGKCALDYVKTAREAFKAQERNALNPFGPDKRVPSAGAAQDTTYRVNPYQSEREEDMASGPTAPPAPAAPPASSSAALVSAPTKKRPSALPPTPPIEAAGSSAGILTPATQVRVFPISPDVW